MDFSFTDEHKALREMVRSFAEDRIAPYAEAWGSRPPLPRGRGPGDGRPGAVRHHRRRGIRRGRFGVGEPVYRDRGARSGRSIKWRSRSRRAWVWGSIRSNPSARDEQKARWLPDLVAGRTLAGFGLTEPEAGSDAGATATKAVLDGAEWVINGSKAFITNSGADMTSVVTITARTGPDEISCFIVPSGTPGFIVEPAYRKMGWHASDTHGLTFVDCRVPAENLLGERGRGFHQFLATLDDGRIAIAAMAVGVLQACLDESLAYAKERQSFGKPIGSYQAIAFKVADLQVMTEAARLLTYRAAWLKDTGQPFKQEAAIAKLYATEAAVSATREATQVFGGAGFIDQTPVARHYRDAKILEIGEGTSEVQALGDQPGLGPADPLGARLERPGAQAECTNPVAVDDRGVGHHSETRALRHRDLSRAQPAVSRVHDILDQEHPGVCDIGHVGIALGCKQVRECTSRRRFRAIRRTSIACRPPGRDLWQQAHRSIRAGRAST